jgi:hypothetical protein
VGVAPQELYGVIAHWHLVYGADILGHRFRVQPGPPGHFLDAASALAAQPQQPVGVDATVAVIPQDNDVIAGYIYLFRSDYFF